MLERLQTGLKRLGLELMAHQQQQLLDYLALIAKWNKVYNLTAIRDEGDMLTHHLLDSLAVIVPLHKYLDRQKTGLQANSDKTCRLLDVGAGAGLPGVVVAICCPSLEVCCVDAVGKKASFISQAAMRLGLKNLFGIHARVEALESKHVREGFDVITSRAFAALANFVQLTEGLLKPTGVWMAMKAKTADVESVALPNNIAVFHVEQLQVPDLNEERCLVWMRRA